ncbi:MAG: hypothetical protein IT370_17325 [Deltaproteobacteria bacterium]|nr:hypothetical protein [Deltaproteobacteria bacterium]
MGLPRWLPALAGLVTMTMAGCGGAQGPWRTQGVRTVETSACALEAPELRAQVTVSQRGEVTARLQRRCVRQVLRRRVETAQRRGGDRRAAGIILALSGTGALLAGGIMELGDQVPDLLSDKPQDDSSGGTVAAVGAGALVTGLVMLATNDTSAHEVRRELPAQAESETVWLPVALSPDLVPPWGGTVKGVRMGAAVRYQLDWSEVPSLEPSSVQRVWRLQLPGGIELGWVPSEVEAFRLLSAATAAATAPAGAPSAATYQP